MPEERPGVDDGQRRRLHQYRCLGFRAFRGLGSPLRGLGCKGTIGVPIGGTTTTSLFCYPQFRGEGSIRV